MLEPGEVVYGFIKDIHPPKSKYIVTIYRDDDLRIVTCFTTTKNRVGIPLSSLQHGYVRKDSKMVGYFFDKEVIVGHNPATELEFHFPCDCVIPFEYGVREGYKEDFLSEIVNPSVVCVLNPDEYENIVYAMYRSPHTNSKYKPYLEKVLKRLRS